MIGFYHDIKNFYSEAKLQLDELQKTYEANQEEFEKLRGLYPDKRIENKNEKVYYDIRDMFNDKIPKEYLDGVIYFFINKTAFSGMTRYNKKGEFNVPYGRYKNFNTKLITEEHAKLLKNTEIYNLDYEEIFNMANHHDFLFLDPPYHCVFNNYGNKEYKDGFPEEEQIRLAENFRNLNCKGLMVIGKTKFTEELYKKYICFEYPVKYAVNIKNRFDTNTTHIVIKNY